VRAGGVTTTLKWTFQSVSTTQWRISTPVTTVYPQPCLFNHDHNNNRRIHTQIRRRAFSSYDSLRSFPLQNPKRDLHECTNPLGLINLFNLQCSLTNYPLETSLLAPKTTIVTATHEHANLGIVATDRYCDPLPIGPTNNLVTDDHLLVTDDHRHVSKIGRHAPDQKYHMRSNYPPQCDSHFVARTLQIKCIATPTFTDQTRVQPEGKTQWENLSLI
jgi:hypothetical protein